MELFLGKVLVKNNSDRDELDIDREIINRLQNRILMLFFGSWECERCQEFFPKLKDFYKHLTDEFYVERSAQLVLIYVSLDDSEDQLEKVLKKMPKRSLFLNHEDPYRKELGVRFEVQEIPTVVVLRPDTSVLLPNAVSEIRELGPDCFRHWQQGTELIDRNFEMQMEFDDSKMRSITDPIRKLKYKVEKKKKRRGWFLGGWGRHDNYDEEEDDEEQSGEAGGSKSLWD